jgi:hypothetical protein
LASSFTDPPTQRPRDPLLPAVIALNPKAPLCARYARLRSLRFVGACMLLIGVLMTIPVMVATKDIDAADLLVCFFSLFSSSSFHHVTCQPALQLY